VSKLRRSFVFLTVVMGLLATSGIALAGHEDSHAEDTQFSFGYDEANRILSLNIGPNWDPYVCDFENGELTAKYGGAVDGIIPITELKDDGDPKMFAPRPKGELGADETLATESVEYAGAEVVCGLSGVVVAGPNGQVNHGQFMKAAKSLFDIKGQGCIVRYLAQSDIGKTEATKLTVSDVDPPFEIGQTGEVPFSTFEADCVRGKKARETNGESARKGRPDSPGKSGKAPGKNKP
jgi:hypothetical protein